MLLWILLDQMKILSFIGKEWRALAGIGFMGL